MAPEPNGNEALTRPSLTGWPYSTLRPEARRCLELSIPALGLLTGVCFGARSGPQDGDGPNPEADEISRGTQTRTNSLT